MAWTHRTTYLGALALVASASGLLGGGCIAQAPEKSSSSKDGGADSDESPASEESDEDRDVPSDEAAPPSEGPAPRDAGDAGGASPGTRRDAGGGASGDAGGATARDAGPAVDASRPTPAPGTPADAGKPQPPTADGGGPVAPAPSEGGCTVGPIPEALRTQRKIGAFYKKYADANGIPVLSSDKPVDKTLILACQLVNELVSERADVRDALIRNKVHFTIIAETEKTTDPPEFSHLPDYYNTRARGLGGQVGMCAEESILCNRAKDRWYGESICVHEFAHTVAMYGLYAADRTFESRLTAAYREATGAGLWRNTYAGEQPQEYWAEGVQNWYNTNLESATPNGVHGPINTKDELRTYDRKLYDLVDELLPDAVKWNDCYRRK